jgi:hypothetical protein
MTSEPAVPLRGAPGLVLAVRFLSELALLAGLAVAGARLGGGVVLSIVFAVLLPVVAALVWGRFIAPRAPARLAEPARFVAEAVLFAAAGVVLVLTDWLVAGVVLAVAGIGIAAVVRVVAKDH